MHGIQLQLFASGRFLKLTSFHYTCELTCWRIRLLGSCLGPELVLVHLRACSLAEWFLSEIFIASIKRRLPCITHERCTHTVNRILIYRCSLRIRFENGAHWLLVSYSCGPLIIRLHCCLVVDHCFRAGGLVHLGPCRVVTEISWVFFYRRLCFYHLKLLHH